MTAKEKQIMYSLASVALLIGAFVIAQNSRTAGDNRMISAFEQSWPEFQKTLPVYPIAGGQEWFLDGVQVIAPDVLLAQFEDGHVGHVAVVKYERGVFESQGVFKDRLTFDRDYYLDVLGFFGDTGFERKSYVLGETERLTEVSENIMMSQNN